MTFPYCIIDGTSYSFCTTSCIHVNLTKIALLLIEESIIDSLYSSIFFFLPSCCLSQVSGRKDKTLYFIPPNFSRKKLSRFSCWTVLASLLTFERITLIEPLVVKFYTWTFQLLPINQEEGYFSSSLTTLAVRSSSISSLSSLPLSKAGAKVHGLSSHPNFTTIPPVLNYAWLLIFRYYAKTRTALFLLRQPIQEAKKHLPEYHSSRKQLCRSLCLTGTFIREGVGNIS